LRNLAAWRIRIHTPQSLVGKLGLSIAETNISAALAVASTSLRGCLLRLTIADIPPAED